MLNSTTKLLLFAFLILFTANSCKKKNDQKSKTQLLTQKSWVMIKYEEKENNGGFVDFFPGFDACDKDDKYTFFTNNTVTYDPMVKCDPSETTQTGSWAFTDNETKITFGLGNYSVLQLDENTLVVSNTYTSGADTYTEKLTFGH